MKLCTVIVLGENVLSFMQVFLNLKLQMAAMGNFSLTFGLMVIEGYRIRIYCSASFTDIE